MSAPVIPPVALPNPTRPPGAAAVGPASIRRPPPPLAPLPTFRAADTVYGFAAVDSRGRVSDKNILRRLGWAPGTRLDIRTLRGLLVAHACPEGVFSVTSQGYLGLPAQVRRWCDLRPNDRVLLVAELAVGQLIVYSPAALDDMVAASLDRLCEGGDAT
ncbi:hypothetical protein GCM10023321_27220 [Pseudonocardia eucalypti]|uniref:SpoVT-AbrB domain-containing protein n=1 Tax=Pseudonocardia eucalypti TaxID=648755 RepID=A0ABP9Q6H1_9PSEU|nr:hypothetical protein [Pseudonocardia eucalypti]